MFLLKREKVKTEEIKWNPRKKYGSSRPLIVFFSSSALCSALCRLRFVEFMVMLCSNRCDQVSSTASTRNVTSSFNIRRLQSRRALYFTPLSPLRRNQPLPSRHGSKESLSKRKMANLGNFARQVLKLFD